MELNKLNLEREFSENQMELLITELKNLFHSTARIYNQNHRKPNAGSLVSKELRNRRFEPKLKQAFDRGILSMEITADHFMGLADCLEPPTLSFAPYTCCRAVQESSSITCWLLDNEITFKERTKRVLALQYKELEEEKKFFRSIPDYPQKTDSDRRILVLEDEAKFLEFEVLYDKKKKRIGIGKKKPSVITLITDAHGSEQVALYRALSGVAHGNHEVSSQLGTRETMINTESGSERALRKHIPTKMIFTLAFYSVVCLESSLKSAFEIFGWNSVTVKKEFSETQKTLLRIFQ